jgi:hypothetical protein
LFINGEVFPKYLSTVIREGFMIDLMKTKSRGIISYSGKFCHFLIILALLILSSAPAQDNDYWSNAPTGKTKVFAISFADEQNGRAISAEGDVLATSDGGKNWAVEKEVIVVSIKDSNPILWKADIYCAIMKTTDGGNIWIPYEEEKQEHFCGVYLKDENTGYKVASEFLNRVTMEINYYYMTNKLDSILDHPHQCTEYYKSPDEGWALGWCVRNFNK